MFGTDTLRDREEGASLVLVALSMVALIGFVGLAIDAGALFGERRQLSRGADAVVLAVAEDCALDSKPCTDTQAALTGEEYADANADGTEAAIDEIILDLSEQTVFARTKSWDPNTGTDQFPLFFMPALGIESTTVAAEAKAIWGVPTGGGAIPLILSGCEWDLNVADGTTFGDPHTFYFHDGNTPPDDCNANPGQDADGDGRLPGGFGWLDTSEDCVTYVTTIGSGDWYYEDPGSSPSNGCSADEMRALLMGDQPILIPIFEDADGVVGAGANGRYQVEALAAFYVYGYNFGGQFKEYRSPLAGVPCSGDLRCLSGEFREYALYEGEIDPNGDGQYGVFIIKLIG